MTPQVQSKLLDLLKELEKGVEFGREQAPIIVEQLLTYNMYVSASLASLGFVLLFIAIWLWKKTTSGAYDEIVYIISAIVAILGALMVTINAAILVKVITAPNLFVLDYIRTIS